MPLGELIQVTVLPPRGVAFVNYEATRRLRELGLKHTPTGRRMTTKSKLQMDFLRGYRQVRNLDHYRALVGDQRSQGPMHWYEPGMTLLMQRTVRPKRQRAYYVILDTAIGGGEQWINDLINDKMIQVTNIEVAAIEGS